MNSDPKEAQWQLLEASMEPGESQAGLPESTLTEWAISSREIHSDTEK